MSVRRSRTLNTLAWTALTTLAAASVAHADAPGVLGDEPTFFTWQPPLGDAAEDGRVIEFLRFMTHKGPEKAADKIIDMIKDRGLQQGEVAILLQNFGMGHGDPSVRPHAGPALFGHWCDGLAHKPRMLGTEGSCERAASRDVVKRWWDTPWMTHGIAESRAWMEAFIARYKERQASDPTIPDPDRFHFDSEGRSHVVRKTSTDIFVAMMRDSRWDSEPVPGFGGRTMAELYEEAGSPEIRATVKWSHFRNWEWANWYETILATSADAGMNEAAYELVRAAWPDAKSSNYGTSDRYDNLGSPVRGRGKAEFDWMRTASMGFGDLQAPVLYMTHERYREQGESPQDAAVRWAAHKVNANVFSFDGPHRDVTPWILGTGYRATKRGQEMRVTQDMTRDQMAMLRSFGVNEILLWADDTTQRGNRHWNEFSAAVEQVWSPKVVDADVLRGSANNASLANLQYRLEDAVQLQSAFEDGQHVVALELRAEMPRAIGAEDEFVRLDVVTTGGAPGFTAEIVAPNGTVSPMTLSSGHLGAVVAASEPGAAVVWGDDTVTIRLRWAKSSSFDMGLDLAQVTFDAVPASETGQSNGARKKKAANR